MLLKKRLMRNISWLEPYKGLIADDGLKSLSVEK
jgi:hypothetical protein